MKIGYLGPSGTYCEEALEIFGKVKDKYEAVQLSTIYDVLEAVKYKKLDYGIVPIENSIEGSVNVTLDVLAESTELKISGEVILPIKHNLLVKEDTDFNEVEFILSHPQALAQCGKYLHKHLPQAGTKPAFSTAEAAKEVSQSQKKWAAIANFKAADAYGLKIAAVDIQDAANNATRFVEISLEDSVKTGKDKTSIVFSAEDKPGSLYKILSIFNLWDINLTKIESRPAKNELGRYIFFVDFEGHREEQDIKDALTMIKRRTSFIHILGSYTCLN